jgi:head-tail adaptor
MAFSAGDLNYRYKLQASTVASTSDAGDNIETWATTATFWGGRESEGGPQNEYMEGGAPHGQETELVKMRYRAGMTPEKRLLRLRDASTLAAGINNSVTTVTLAAALKFDGSGIDYLLIEDEIVRVTAGGTTTSLTVERGALGTSPASHSSSVACTRVEKLEILGIARADEREDELVVRVKRND